MTVKKTIRERKKYLKKFQGKLLSASKSAEVYNKYYVINHPKNERAFRSVLNEQRGQVFRGYTRTARNWQHHHVLTFSFNNIRNSGDIRNALEEVYRSSTRALRFTIYFHSIWEQETRESEVLPPTYVYFSSTNSHNRNPYLMVTPGHTEPEERMHYIRNKSQLNHYKDQLNDERIQAYMRGSSTRVTPIGIYKVDFKIVRRNVPLGGITNLPSYITNCGNIISLKDIDDGDCPWACMAFASGCRRDRWKTKAQELKLEWQKYTILNKSVADSDAYASSRYIYIHLQTYARIYIYAATYARADAYLHVHARTHARAYSATPRTAILYKGSRLAADELLFACRETILRDSDSIRADIH